MLVRLIFSLAALNLLLAFVTPGFGLSLYGSIIFKWGVRHKDIVEKGALVESPELVGGSVNTDWWLMHELLPDLEQQLATPTHILALLFLGQGVVLLILGFSTRKQLIKCRVGH